jgi:hypothetical protein
MTGSLAISIFLPCSMKHLYVHRGGVAGKSAIRPVFNRKETLWQRAANQGLRFVGCLWRWFDENVEVVTRERALEWHVPFILFILLHFQ